MNCANHSDVVAAAYCRTCGKPLCGPCTRNVGGVVYCESCLAERVQGAPGQGSQTTPGMGVPLGAPQANPMLAGLLGFIPGVGAMYNGQFVKGVIHALGFVVLIGLTTKIGIFGILIGFAEFYMVFDAYKTAEALRYGLPVPDPFGLERMFGPGVNQTNWQRSAPPGAGGIPSAVPGAPQWDPAQQQAYAEQQQAYAAQQASCAAGDLHGVPIAAVILIGLGSLFLLNSLGWFSFDWDRFWPVILIFVGLWMFYKRWTRRVS